MTFGVRAPKRHEEFKGNRRILIAAPDAAA